MTRNKIIIKFYASLLFIYHATVFKFIPVSMVAQALTIALSSLSITFEKFRLQTFLLLLLSCSLVIFQGRHALAFATIIFIYILSRKMDLRNLSGIYVKLVLVISILSLIHFYSGLNFLYDPVYFTNYILTGLDRLLGLDRSPAQLGFLVGLSIILCLFLYKRHIKWLFIIFFFLILIATASRTAILGLAFAISMPLFGRIIFTHWIVFIVMFPFILIWFYFAYFGNMPYMIIIETLSSNRIVNWVNLVHHFLQSDLMVFFFGMGKPEVIEQPFIVDSFSGEYTYLYVTYAESSILKILTYHGFLLFFISFLYLIRCCWGLRVRTHSQ